MATGLLAKTAPPTIGNTSSLFRCAFTFVRNFSATAPPDASAANAVAPDAGATKPKWKKKKKNFFEVAQFLPNWGIGYRMAKTHWSGVSYEITKINLYKDGRHGKAWGIVHKDACVVFISDPGNGFPGADAPKKISGVHKRCWRYIPNSKVTKEDIASKPELQTA